MLLFINNVNPTELLLIAVVAVLVFGRRLPEVAGQAAGQLAKAKKAVQDLRRESGLDEELRQARQAAKDLDPRRLVDAPKPVRAADSVQRARTPLAGTPAGPVATKPEEQAAPRDEGSTQPLGGASMPVASGDASAAPSEGKAASERRDAPAGE